MGPDPFGRALREFYHDEQSAPLVQFDAGRFESVLVRGTQFGLAKSMAGIEELLADLATVTTDTATIVLDC